MNNILLDRFRWETVPFFYRYFSSAKKKVKIISYNGIKPLKIDTDKVTLLEDFEVSKGTFFLQTPWCLNSNDLKFYSKHEGLFINLLSRFTISPSNWSVNEMATHGLNLLNFWKYQLLEKKITVCYGYYTPHDPSSFSLYMVCKYLKIPYIFIDCPQIFSKYRHLSCSLENRNLLIQNKFSKSPIWVKDIIHNYSIKIKKNFKSAQPDFMRFKISNKPLHERINYYRLKTFKIIKKEKFRSIDIIIRKLFNKIVPQPPIFFKFNRNFWNSKAANIGRFKFLLIKMRIYFRLRNIRNFYIKNCFKLDQHKKINYIYFAAHLAPEASLLPMSMWNANQEAALKSIIKVLPKNWNIIYKANPSQFNFDANHSAYIDWYSKEYYKNLLKTGKIIFAPINFSSVELINKSKGVATICGTTSLEAVFNEKNCIIFSSIWFEKLNGIYLCKSQKDLKLVINKMKNQEKPNPQPLKNLFLEQTTFKVSRYVPISFAKKDLKTVADKFLSSEKIFKKLGPEKWNF